MFDCWVKYLITICYFTLEMAILTRATRVNGQRSAAANRPKKTTLDIATSATRLMDGSGDAVATLKRTYLLHLMSL